jgi:hypothetical protein
LEILRTNPADVKKLFDDIIEILKAVDAFRLYHIEYVCGAIYKGVWQEPKIIKPNEIPTIKNQQEEEEEFVRMGRSICRGETRVICEGEKKVICEGEKKDVLKNFLGPNKLILLAKSIVMTIGENQDLTEKHKAIIHRLLLIYENIAGKKIVKLLDELFPPLDSPSNSADQELNKVSSETSGHIIQIINNKSTDDTDSESNKTEDKTNSDTKKIEDKTIGDAGSKSKETENKTNSDTGSESKENKLPECIEQHAKGDKELYKFLKNYYKKDRDSACFIGENCKTIVEGIEMAKKIYAEKEALFKKLMNENGFLGIRRG